MDSQLSNDNIFVVKDETLNSLKSPDDCTYKRFDDIEITSETTHVNDYVIKLENVFYSYNKNNALNGINMYVDRGTIYGLIGASGCGKTTALRIIIGLLKPSSGSITVFSNTTGTSSSLIPGPGVGYMPQELALYPFLTIKEILYFYAQLNDVDSDLRNERINDLIELLNLPKDNKLISTLSGGQKRRVSLAATLIHEPPLLILDEPTVGVDPILRRNIWDYLRNICLKHKQTIIITTHYHEEAKLSDCVGLMRNGRLLIEESPMEILTQMNLNSIEDVFFKLSLDDDSKFRENNNYKNKSFNDVAKSETNLRRRSSGTNETFVKYRTNSLIERTLKEKNKPLNKLFAFFKKNSLNMKRNVMFNIAALLSPVFQIILTAICFGRNPRDITIAVYDSDSSFSSRYVISHIDTESINLEYYNSLPNAIDSVKKGHSWAVISFPSNFTAALKDASNKLKCECEDETKLLNHKTSLKDTRIPQIEIFMDESDLLISGFVKLKIVSAIKDAAIDSSEIFGIGESSLMTSPIKLSDPPIHGEANMEMTAFIIPNLFVLLPFFVGMSMTALSLFAERENAILERSLSAGVKPYQIILSIISIQIPTLILQIVLIFTAVFVTFDVSQNGSFVLVYALSLVMGLCGVSLGLLISSIANSVFDAFLNVNVLLMPILLFSGIFWPLESVPKFIVYLTYPFPVNFAGAASRSIIGRGWDLSYSTVQLGFAIPIIWVIILFILASHSFRKVI